MTPYEIMALRLQEVREAANKTQKDAATYLGCTPQAISNYERAKTKIDSVAFLRLLLYYNVDIYEFLDSCGFREMKAIRSSTPEIKHELVEAYADADFGTQQAVRKLLDLPLEDSTTSRSMQSEPSKKTQAI